jgi:hypothetical protein
MKDNKSEKPSWPLSAFAPLGGPPVRIIRRGDDTQLRLTWLPGIGDAGALDCRLYRRSPNVQEVDEEYGATGAGFCIPKGRLREFWGVLGELAAQLDR